MRQVSDHRVLPRTFSYSRRRSPLENIIACCLNELYLILYVTLDWCATLRLVCMEILTRSGLV